MAVAGADDQGRRIARREGLRSDENPVIGRTILRKIDHGRSARGAGRDSDRQHCRGSLASAGLRTVGIVDNGKIRSLGALRDLHPHGRGRRIVGETDVKVGMPGDGSDLDRGIADGDAGVRARQPSAACEHSGKDQWNNRGQNLETQHDTPFAPSKPATRRAYGWRSVNKTRYRWVDVPIRHTPSIHTLSARSWGLPDSKFQTATVILRREPSSASLEGWATFPAAILRDAAKRPLLRMTAADSVFAHRDSGGFKFQTIFIRGRNSAISPRIFARVFHQHRTLLDQREQGMPGARSARSLACKSRKHASKSPRSRRVARHSPRNGFNGFLRALPGDRALLPPSSAESLPPT
jgi:hypothetical protein